MNIRQNHFTAAAAIGKLLGLRTYDSAQGRRIPAPYLIHNPKISQIHFLVYASDRTSISWLPFDDVNGWCGLIWAFRFVGLTRVDTTKTAAENARYLVKVLTSPTLLSAMTRYRQFLAEAPSAEEAISE